jgi:hypothetical protein
MWAEASTILRAVAADFFFNCWYCECIRCHKEFTESLPSNCIVEKEQGDRKQVDLTSLLLFFQNKEGRLKADLFTMLDLWDILKKHGARLYAI